METLLSVEIEIGGGNGSGRGGVGGIREILFAIAWCVQTIGWTGWCMSVNGVGPGTSSKRVWDGLASSGASDWFSILFVNRAIFSSILQLAECILLAEQCEQSATG